MEERELLDVGLKHAGGRATLRDIEREVERQTAAGYLIRETPLYRVADHPTTERPRSRTAWIASVVELGVARDAARERVDQAVAQGRLVPAEHRYTKQTPRSMKAPGRERPRAGPRRGVACGLRITSVM